MAKSPKESHTKEAWPSQAINSHRIPSLSDKRKLQHPEQYQRNTLPQPNGPSYWDNLSKTWFTKSALKELDRRNTCLGYQRSATPTFDLNRKESKPQFASDFLRNCSPRCLKHLERLSRQGGPDLSDLRNYPDPRRHLDEPRDPAKSTSQGHAPLSLLTPSTEAGTSDGATETTCYSRNFWQHLIDHAIYDSIYLYPEDEKPPPPDNWDEIHERLARRRPSLSPSRFSEKDFKKFYRLDANASKKKLWAEVVPTIKGDSGDPKHTGGYLFGNLDHLTDGTLPQAKPNHFYGARPEQLDLEIREKLSSQIIPSTQDDLPIIPNFFLEARDPEIPAAVAKRQACYNGALGARAIHALQSYQKETLFDNNAYTIASTYSAGTLTLHTIHITKYKGPGCRPEYTMTQLGGWAITGSLETFRQGVSGYRNARDWAKEARDKLIESANRRHREGQSRRAAIAP